MKRTLAILVVFQAAASLALGGDETLKTRVAPGRAEDQKAIQSANEAFIRAYNSAQSRAIAQMFTDDAEAIDADGNEVRGRKAIEDVFDTIFEENAGSKLEIAFGAIRFLGTDVAVETGRTKLTPPGRGTSESDRFLILLVKRDGRWLPAFVQEIQDRPVAHHEQLKELEWMLGEWVNQSSNMDVVSTCEWSDDRNFLVRLFTIHVPGKPPISGTQRIGWDPSSQRLRSWVFDTQGGFSEGIWSHKGDQWTIEESGVLGDGKKATATQVFTVEKNARVRWRSISRTVDGKPAPDLGELIMVKKPD